MALQTTLLSAGVLVTATTQAAAPIPTPTTIPLIFIATRANKPTPDGSGVAAGTTESNVMRIITSQSELLQSYGNPVFVTSDGLPVHGDETNEYGLITAYSACGITNTVYIVRADIDLGQLIPTTVEPTFPPPNGTFWIDTTSVVGGILTFNGTTWSSVPFTVYTETPDDVDDGDDGDWAFDYSTLNGTLMFKAGGEWWEATTDNIQDEAGATNPLYVQSTTPVGAVAGDFWYKTTSSNGGTDLALGKYRASDASWQEQIIIRQDTAPDPDNGDIWEDTSALATTGNRPLYIGTGVEFIPLVVVISDTAPVTTPDDGTLWFDDTLTDFALYVESGNSWHNVETTTVSNPTNRQKVISASPPQFPDVDAIWVDVSTTTNIDNFPVIKQWDGDTWVTLPSSEDVQPSVRSIHVQSADPIASLVADGAYWLNIGASETRNLVKRYDSTFVAYTLNGTTVEVEEDNHWAPATDDIFGRKSQRHMVASALKQAIADNDEIRSENNYYQMICCPGYVETYPDIGSLNEDINQISLALFDIPKFVTPSGVPEGREITISDWITNTRNAEEPNEDGFPAGQSGDPYQANAYPGGLATNPTDGQLVYVPPTYILLRTIAYNDSVAYPWSPPAGPNRGVVKNVASVGRINDEGQYVQFSMNRAQRDICYTHSVNPIATIPNVGLCVWGQKTMAVAGSILDRINVVRLICKMKYDFSRLMLPFLFELNNATTRRNATIVAERYLAGLVSLQALYDYAVLCDDSNNTGSIIAQHKLIVDVAIKPQQSIEFIYVPILVLNPDDQFPF